MHGKSEVAVATQSILGEGSFWDSEKGVLYWCDIEKKLLHVFDPERDADKRYALPEKIGTVVPKKSGGLLVALESGVASFNPERGVLHQNITLEKDLPNNRFNDGKCDPAGRFWVGSMAPHDESGNAHLYRIETDYSVQKVLSGITISNGIVWSRDKRRMYYIDTPTGRIDRFDYDIETGNISGRAPCVRVPDGMGHPDGMAIDSEGKLWVALYGGWGVGCWNPETGKLLDRIELPVSNVTSCAFGGKDLDTLYVTTARSGLSETDLKKQEYAGSLFRVAMGVRGVPSFPFGG